jgi:hypothetical protein
MIRPRTRRAKIKRKRTRRRTRRRIRRRARKPRLHLPLQQQNPQMTPLPLTTMKMKPQLLQGLEL